MDYDPLAQYFWPDATWREMPTDFTQGIYAPIAIGPNPHFLLDLFHYYIDTDPAWREASIAAIYRRGHLVNVDWVTFDYLVLEVHRPGMQNIWLRLEKLECPRDRSRGPDIVILTNNRSTLLYGPAINEDRSYDPPLPMSRLNDALEFANSQFVPNYEWPAISNTFCQAVLHTLDGPGRHHTTYGSHQAQYWSSQTQPPPPPPAAAPSSPPSIDMLTATSRRTDTRTSEPLSLSFSFDVPRALRTRSEAGSSTLGSYSFRAPLSFATSSTAASSSGSGDQLSTFPPTLPADPQLRPGYGDITMQSGNSSLPSGSGPTADEIMDRMRESPAERAARKAQAAQGQGASVRYDLSVRPDRVYPNSSQDPSGLNYSRSENTASSSAGGSRGPIPPSPEPVQSNRLLLRLGYTDLDDDDHDDSDDGMQDFQPEPYFSFSPR